MEPPPGARRSDRPGFARQESGTGGGGGGGGGFDSMENRSGFGARFTPATPRELQPARRPAPESLEPSVGDNASDWRTGKPTTENLGSLSPRKTSGSPAGPMGAVDGARGPMRSGPRGDATEIDEKYANQERLGFGSKFVATPPESPSMNKRPGFGFEKKGSNTAGVPGPSAAGPGEEAETWRSAKRPSAKSPSEGGSPAQAAPAQRKKLELKPRTVAAEGSNATTTTTAAAATSNSGRANPFGMAKPIDAGEREREIEAKLAAQEKERKEEEKKRKEKLRTDKEKAQAQAPTGPKADRNRSRGPTSEKGSETSSTPAVDADNSTSTVPPSASILSPKQGPPPPIGAWGGGRKPSGALVSGEQSPVAKEYFVNGVATEETNGQKGVEAAEVQKAVESLSVVED